ncbi:hypothetical protein ACHBIF_02665 [Streptococcus sp. A11]|uniref:hypothetical protein n=1 Tax=unclassified Streptococcus TaxID=2608887 RepID=UPI00374D6234
MKNHLSTKRQSILYCIIYIFVASICLVSYWAPEPFASPSLLTVPITISLRVSPSQEDIAYYLLQIAVALLALLLVFGIGVWLEKVKPIGLLFPLAMGLYLVYLITKKE